MLKNVLLNGKKLPVPVPVKSMSDALGWLEDYLIEPKKTITKIELDGVVLEDESCGEMPLTASSRLVVQADSAIELAIQTIDALRNMVGVIIRDIKHCAVQVYQLKAEDSQEFLDNFLCDLGLMLDLSNHLFGLVGDYAEYNDLSEALSHVETSLGGAHSFRANMDWTPLARLILQKIEPEIQDVSNKLVAFQKKILELDAMV